MPKGEDAVDNGAIDVSSLRPIVIQSILVRVLTSTFVRQREVQDWVLSKVPRFRLL